MAGNTELNFEEWHKSNFDGFEYSKDEKTNQYTEAKVVADFKIWLTLKQNYEQKLEKLYLENRKLKEKLRFFGMTG